MLRCELSKAVPVEWTKGSETLRAGARVSLRQDGTACELEIRGLAVEDAGEYSCVCGQERTSATLTIQGKDRVWPSRTVIWCSVYFVMSMCSHSLFPSFSHFPGSPYTHYSVEYLPFLGCCVNHEKPEFQPHILLGHISSCCPVGVCVVLCGIVSCPQQYSILCLTPQLG